MRKCLTFFGFLIEEENTVINTYNVSACLLTNSTVELYKNFCFCFLTSSLKRVSKRIFKISKFLFRSKQKLCNYFSPHKSSQSIF